MLGASEGVAAPLSYTFRTLRRGRQVLMLHAEQTCFPRDVKEMVGRAKNYTRFVFLTFARLYESQGAETPARG